ncbi:CAP domain-containing protein [Streptomyces sp. NPDC005925]|uniref:CAP domain-containing protein n=1 Tax=Streptomyces sp. NPDC005925 TaxID=3157172 RepID=UPI0033CF1972
MGRHRRSAAGRAATGRATGSTQPDGRQGHDEPSGSYGGDHPTTGIAPYLNPEAYAETYAKTEAFLYATDDDYTPASGTPAFPADGDHEADGGVTQAGPRRRRKKKGVPVRAGLLGASAAVALGTVAVATGAVPGLDGYRIGGGFGTGDRVQAADSATSTPSVQGGTSGSADGRDSTATSRDTDRSTSPAAPTSPSAPKSSAAPTTEAPSKKPESTPSEKPQRTATPKATKAPVPDVPPVTLSEEAAAAAQVLKLVNDERAQAGCSPVAANSALTDLASDFSEDMAERGFFDHTDPSGATPWDRAEKAGISNLGGENIARGQAGAVAVMEAWMNSPGHRANILNCDFKKLGVGVHFAQGGPWWTQDFGY